MIACYLSLGSNQASPERQLRKALTHIALLPKTVLSCQSPITKTIPHGVSWQPGYRNMIIKVLTNLEPLILLSYCQKIENKQQRVRKKKWGPRTLDIDILLYGDVPITHRNLTVPHPEIHNREFISSPLYTLIKERSSSPFNS